MKILKRLLFGTFAILAMFFILIEIPYYSIRWVLTGASFPEVPISIMPFINLLDKKL